MAFQSLIGSLVNCGPLSPKKKRLIKEFQSLIGSLVNCGPPDGTTAAFINGFNP